jgi:putative heme-binding domain-containing protein
LLASADGPLAPRVAAIFTLEQLLGRDAIAMLVKLAVDPGIREFALKALADRRENEASIPAQPFLDGLTDSNPRVRLQAVVALGRLSKAKAASALVARTADDDPLVAHVAVKALVALNAVPACLAALDPADPKLAPGAARALQAMHCTEAVDGLISKLANSPDSVIHRLAFKALCRLDHREAEYSGDWWTTRPDTSGPYYKPVAWEESKKIEWALSEALKQAKPGTSSELLIELTRNKVQLEGAGSVDIDLATLEPSARAAVVDLLFTRRSLPEKTIRYLEEIALSDKESPALRAKVLAGFIRQQRRSAFRLLAAIGQQSKLPDAVLDVWRDYLHDDAHVRRVSEYRRLAKDKEPSLREFGFTVLLTLELDPKTPAWARSDAEKAIESAWSNPRDAASLLKAIGRTDSMSYAFQVRNHLKDEHREVKEAAEFAAAMLDLNYETPSANRGPTIASLPFESIFTAAQTEQGNAKLGERVFQRQGCIACHTVALGQAPKGPSLLGIAERYKRPELIESILKPSAKLAQGFEPQKIATVDGRTFEGFVVRESGSEIELRDGQGRLMVISKKDIDARARGEVSIMPAGLADGLTVRDFSSLLAYLESLKSK